MLADMAEVTLVDTAAEQEAADTVVEAADMEEETPVDTAVEQEVQVDMAVVPVVAVEKPQEEEDTEVVLPEDTEAVLPLVDTVAVPHPEDTEAVPHLEDTEEAHLEAAAADMAVVLLEAVEENMLYC